MYTIVKCALLFAKYSTQNGKLGDECEDIWRVQTQDKTAASRPDEWPGDELLNCVVRKQHDFASRTQSVIQTIYQSIRLSAYLCIYMSICLSIYSFIRLFISMCTYTSLYPSIYPSIYLFVCLSRMVN